VHARDLNAHGAMAALLKDAIKPNLVQTLENNLAIIHGGPFANIAHGCNSVTATKTALKLADYVITEAGFGADLGAEKFIDIKCRMAGLKPSAIVLVATVRAVKYHGGVNKEELNKENLKAMEKGMENVERHINNIQQHYGLPCVVSINHFTHDTDAEIKLLKERIEARGAKAVVAKHWADGGAGAVDLAHAVIDIVDNSPGQHSYVYDDNDSLWHKLEAVAKKIYGAGEITATQRIRNQIKELERDYKSFPVCMAKTQMSFTTDPAVRGAPVGHSVEISELRVANGAGFIVAIAGNMMTMPGLPKVPAAEKIDVDEHGNISGLF
jgi:formate--tetrahydrofolate ligase